jgi:hypothetical protein
MNARLVLNERAFFLCPFTKGAELDLFAPRRYNGNIVFQPPRNSRLFNPKSIQGGDDGEKLGSLPLDLIGGVRFA